MFLCFPRSLTSFLTRPLARIYLSNKTQHHGFHCGQAMFLLVPDPSPLDPQLRGLWDWLQQRVEQCPSTLPDSVLSELVDTLLTRVQCSAASREEVIPIALALTESFMYQVRACVRVCGCNAGEEEALLSRVS